MKIKNDPSNIQYIKSILRQTISHFEDVHDLLLDAIAKHTRIEMLNLNETLEHNPIANENISVYHGKIRVKMNNLNINKCG